MLMTELLGGALNRLRDSGARRVRMGNMTEPSLKFWVLED